MTATPTTTVSMGVLMSILPPDSPQAFPRDGGVFGPEPGTRPGERQPWRRRQSMASFPSSCNQASSRGRHRRPSCSEARSGRTERIAHHRCTPMKVLWIADWLIEPMAGVAIRRLATRGPTVRIERELVMSHRDLVALRALWLDGRVRTVWAAAAKPEASTPSKRRPSEEPRCVSSCLPPRCRLCFIGRARSAAGFAELYIRTPARPSAISASGESRITSDRTFLAPRISTSD